MRGPGRWVAVLMITVLLATGCSTATGADDWPTAPSSVAAGRWTTLPTSPLSARHDAVGAWVGGRFVVAGGRTDTPCADTGSCAGPFQPAERDGASFEPSTGHWTGIAEAPTPVSGTNAVAVGDALYVLVIKTAHDPAAFLRYQAATDRWTRLALPRDRDAILVAGGQRVFAVPGHSDGKAVRTQQFDAASGTWRTLPADPLGSTDFRQATWFDGRLLVAGPPLATSPGAQPAKLRITWWTPATNDWTEPVTGKVTGSDPSTVGDRIVWPGTGATSTDTSTLGGIFDPSTEHWSALPDPLDSDGLERASGLVVGSRIVVGDPSAPPESGRGQLLDPVNRAWTAIPPLPGPARFNAALTAGDGEILVWGGGTANEQNLADGYLLRP